MLEMGVQDTVCFGALKEISKSKSCLAVRGASLSGSSPIVVDSARNPCLLEVVLQH